MPSKSLKVWQRDRLPRLDEVEEAHRTIGGSGRGRRFATQQLNRAYAMLLSAEMQGFCRDLHTEAVGVLTAQVPDPLQTLIRNNLLRGRQLDRGNVQPASLGSDFGQLELEVWPELIRRDSRNARRKEHLEMLNRWRNAIAHQTLESAELGGTTTLRLIQVRRWRSSCNVLAEHLDGVMAYHLTSLLEEPPW